jgi:PIN domain nuclease of toxin-antitoxin system
MIVGVVDTHAIIWYLYNDKHLSRAASLFIDDAVKNNNQIGVSAISLVEIVYFSEKGRIDAQALKAVLETMQLPQGVLVEIPLNADIYQTRMKTRKMET